MTKENKSPQAWGIEMSKFWTTAGMNLPVDPAMLALEVSSKRYEDHIAKVEGHDISGIDGALTKSTKANKWFITYNQNVIEGRANFTISHEFGHYLMHRDQQAAFNCSQDNILGAKNNFYHKKIEKEANIFASFLLMPIDDFRKQIGNNQMSFELLTQCANRYATSVTATALKWVSFTDEAAVVVLATEGFILWAAPSSAARKLKINFKKGDPIPAVSEDRCIYGSQTSKNTIRRAAGVWHYVHESNEDLITSDSYDFDIFLITFPFITSVDFEEEREFDTLDLMNFINSK